jgi:hypothetical protein
MTLMINAADVYHPAHSTIPDPQRSAHSNQAQRSLDEGT